MSRPHERSNNEDETILTADGSSGVSLVENECLYIFEFMLISFLQTILHVSTDSGLTDDERAVRQ